MQRWIFFIYGVSCHVLFFVTYAFMIAFVGNFLLPRTLDSAPANSLYALAVDLGLIGLFALQHSVMARPRFKRAWTRLVPEPIERSTYVLLSSVCVLFLMWEWQGLDGTVWNIQSPTGRWILWGLFAAGWLMVPAVSLMINHFDLFGTRQVWLYLNKQPYTALPFRTPLLYGRVRHPLYVGWALAFWATPTMSLGHLLFAGTLTIYMVAAARIEERDLIGHFGEAYRAYRTRVPMFFPRLSEAAQAAPARPAVPASVYSKTLKS